MMLKSNIFICLCILFLPLVGCVTGPKIYYWGEYEDVLYKSFSKPGEMPAERQIQILEADYQKAKAANKPLPPGWHAHLGTLYYEVGKADIGYKNLITEKKLFPESTVFVDVILKKLGAK